MTQMNMSKSTLKLLVIILALVGGIFISYTYVISPLLLKKSNLEESVKELDARLKDTDSLEVKLEGLKKQVAEKGAEEQNKPEAPQYTALSYLDFVDYIGKLEKTTGVDIISVLEDDYLMAGQYFEVPYTIEVAGDYVELLKFTNGLSELEGLLVWTSVNLSSGSSILTSDKDLLLSTDWATQIKDMLGDKYPNKTVINDPSKQETEESIEKGEALTQDVSPQDGGLLHLDISFKFITVENHLGAGVR